MTSNLPAGKNDHPQTPQEKLSRLVKAAVNNELPGATTTIKDGKIKVTWKNEHEVLLAELRQIGSGLETRQVSFPRRQKGDPAIAEDARRLAAEGKTQKEIGELLGRSQAAVSGYLK